jgi:hypothetical protein
MKALIAAADLTLLPMLGHAAEFKVLQRHSLKTSIGRAGSHVRAYDRPDPPAP